jgi:hypothetical protein
MTIREEIQITDLEPSIEGGQDIRYGVQIRGIDASGRPGPWSEKFEFDSPPQIPSLESFNYVPGEDGWKLDNDGSFEVNNGTIRGTLSSGNYVPNQSGWLLTDSGEVEFSTGVFRGSLKIGQNTFNVDPQGNLFIGGTNRFNSPFSVLTDGTIQAMSISGNFIQANTLEANRIVAGTITADRIANSTITGSKIAGGTITGALIAGGTITGALIANSTIVGAKIADATIVGAKIADATITDAKIASLNADKISGGSISGISISALSLSASGEFNVQSGRLRVIFGGGVVSNTTISASSHMSASSFRVGVSGNDPQYTKDGSEPVIKNASGSTLRVDHIRQLNIGSSVTWSGTGRFFIPTSSKKTKKDITYIEKLPNLLNIKTAIFKPRLPWEIEGQEDFYDDSFFEPGLDKFQIGAIAEDLDALGLDLFVEYNTNNEPSGIKYDKIGVGLIPYVKELYDRIEELERKIDGN